MLEESKESKQSKLGNEEEKGKKSPKIFPLWLKWGLIVFSIVPISAGAYLLAKNVLLPRYQTYRISESITPKNQKPEMGIVHVIEDLTVNTMGSNGHRFVVAEYALESSDEEVINEIKSREPQLRDEFIKYLRNHTATEILSLSFQEMSRSELIRIVNKRLNKGSIDSLYYIKLIVQ